MSQRAVLISTLYFLLLLLLPLQQRSPPVCLSVRSCPSVAARCMNTAGVQCDGRLVRELPDENMLLLFSPDGRRGL